MLRHGGPYFFIQITTGDIGDRGNVGTIFGTILYKKGRDNEGKLCYNNTENSN